jgi:hypothetical protein
MSLAVPAALGDRQRKSRRPGDLVEEIYDIAPATLVIRDLHPSPDAHCRRS